MVNETITKAENSHVLFPSQLDLNQVVNLKFRETDQPLTCTIRAIHFYINKVKYDLGVWLGDGSVDNPETETRIYNVDSCFITPL